MAPATTTTLKDDPEIAAKIDEKYGEALPEPEPFISFNALKDRIRHHYEVASDYYYGLWGEHIHHGYFLTPTDTKELAQTQLITLLLQKSSLQKGSTVLDVGCGIGGTSRYLANSHGCSVTGLTISGRQVEIAKRLTIEAGGVPSTSNPGCSSLGPNGGSVSFLELDAEKMGDYFGEDKVGSFDAVWISEAMSHFPNKALFFKNAELMLKPGGNLIIADWFKDENLSEAQYKADISPIEDGMLLPPLCSQTDYVNFAHGAGFKTFSEPMDISQEVKKTWDISWTLIQNPSLWAFAVSQGRDGLAFFQSFRAMRRGFGNGSFRYAVMVFEK